MPRFFISPEAVCEGVAIISGGDAYHIARSLRMAVGDEITLADGEGCEYLCRLTKIRDEECTAEVLSSRRSTSESPAEISLYMAYPKSDKLELVIQKAVELGATRIIPFESSRCIKRPKAEKIEKQTARLARIAEEAAKQCGRAIIPTVSQPKSFKEMLSEVKNNALTLLCYENEDGRTIKDLLKAEPCPASIGVIVGSEGGFSPEEVVEMTEVGCVSVSLGERILRCETAPSYALSAISYEYEL